MRTTAILIGAVLCVIAPSLRGETSCENEEWYKEGNWYATRLSKGGRVKIGMVGPGNAFVPTDTVRIPGGMLLEEYYHSIERPEEFIMVTDGWKDEIPRTYWLLNARTGELRKLLDVPGSSTLGGVVVGFGGARALISAGREEYRPDAPLSDRSLTYLIDVDTGSIVRTWEGWYFDSCYRQYPSTAHYDRTTEAFWIGPTGYGPGYWTAEDDPKQITRIDCATGDTTWVDEGALFGMHLKQYLPYDVYQGHMLISAWDGPSDEDRTRTWRMMLVDLAGLRPVAEWRGPTGGRDFMIAEDLQGVVYYRDDESEMVHRFYLPMGGTEAVEVELAGGRTP